VVNGDSSNDKDNSYVSMEEIYSSTQQENSVDFTGGVKVGDVIALGSYEQDDVDDNGTEAIDWVVLDVKDGKALVISKYILDARRYNESRTEVTWETCTLRAWLNDDFYNTVFSEHEKSKIQKQLITNTPNSYYGTDGGNSTEDHIFLLSVEEAVRYYIPDKIEEYTSETTFGTHGDTQSYATAYAMSNGAAVSEADGTTWWWLRSTGRDNQSAVYVHYNGSVRVGGGEVDNYSRGVRPCMWITVEDENSSQDVPSDTPEQSRNDESTDMEVPSDTPDESTDMEVPSDTPDESTDMEVPSDTPDESTDMEVPPDEPEVSEETSNGGAGEFSVGDIVVIGQYEQDGNINNGAENIRWKVVEIKGDRALIVSEKVLDVLPYNSKQENTYWATSTLRAWLNDEFYNKAFSDSAKRMIKSTKISNADNQCYGTKSGIDTVDNIFVLSTEEAVKYYAIDKSETVTNNYRGTDGMAGCMPTEYAKSKGTLCDNDRGFAQWWLRTMGQGQSTATYVDEYGGIRYQGQAVQNSNIGVRPAMWVSTST
jgi:hypothetical protein